MHAHAHNETSRVSVKISRQARGKSPCAPKIFGGANSPLKLSQGKKMAKVAVMGEWVVSLLVGGGFPPGHERSPRDAAILNSESFFT